MANTYKIGDVVAQRVPVVTGTVVAKQFIGDDICYHVEFVSVEGEPSSRWFKESELEGGV